MSQMKDIHWLQTCFKKLIKNMDNIIFIIEIIQVLYLLPGCSRNYGVLVFHFLQSDYSNAWKAAQISLIELSGFFTVLNDLLDLPFENIVCIQKLIKFPTPFSHFFPILSGNAILLQVMRNYCAQRYQGLVPSKDNEIIISLACMRNGLPCIHFVTSHSIQINQCVIKLICKQK